MRRGRLRIVTGGEFDGAGGVPEKEAYGEEEKREGTEGWLNRRQMEKNVEEINGRTF